MAAVAYTEAGLRITKFFSTKIIVQFYSLLKHLNMALSLLFHFSTKGFSVYFMPWNVILTSKCVLWPDCPRTPDELRGGTWREGGDRRRERVKGTIDIVLNVRMVRKQRTNVTCSSQYLWKHRDTQRSTDSVHTLIFTVQFVKTLVRVQLVFLGVQTLTNVPTRLVFQRAILA